VTSPTLTLKVLPGQLAVCRLGPDAPVPLWAAGPVTSITRTEEELSVVCAEEAVPPDVRAERGFHCLSVVGPLDFSGVGILASLALPLADAGVSVFVVSTFDTDLLLVRKTLLSTAVAVLRAAGHRISGIL
jgi:hypothetical protein